MSTKTNLASAGTRTASGRRWPAQNHGYHAFISYLRVPSPRQGTYLNPALVEDAFTSAALRAMGVGGGDWWACWVVALAAAFSPPALSDELRLPSRT